MMRSASCQENRLDLLNLKTLLRMWGVLAAFAVSCLASVALALAPVLQFSRGSRNSNDLRFRMLRCRPSAVRRVATGPCSTRQRKPTRSTGRWA